MERRTFVNSMLATGGSTLFPCCNRLSGEANPQDILVLGGTNFVGPAIVERALDRGHRVTLFNRGITRPELFPRVPRLVGNRQIGGADLSALERAGRWDAVIDVWPEQSGLVEATARLLADRAAYYFFTSSIAVYRDYTRRGMTETAPVHVNDPGWYGGEKVLAEAAVERSFPDRSGVVRCHAIVGPRDPGNSYHYWLQRLARYSEVLAPGSGEDPVQLVDVRDVAHWIMDCVEQRRIGVHNLCGPNAPHTMRTFLETTRQAIGSNAELVWADADFLRTTHGVRSFTDMPHWAPLDEDAGFQQISSEKAIGAGAEFRPLAVTARAAWRWYQSHFFKDATFPIAGTGISRERELEILRAMRMA